ncbi:alpha-ketoglutarate-dependent dioxygenase alkB homolog 6 [Elysia marginata]|uniref:Alpha-ketoglutarate-dependent dioxygenase alkB homolog 6 n=1 Tax=Elysia marginata TaxID=1093978 RepID=A0AAV4J2U0_9GAST|nr:alpha-ketoglutarate-dependent dioxygenase alkB homolog 6 [Elysia marginata]
MNSNLDTDICKYLVSKDGPPSLYYIPDFIDREQEDFLLNKVYSAPKPKWTQLAHRRLQNWGGLPHPKGMVAETLPQWLQVYTDKLTQLSLFEGNGPNHVLVNEYLPGQGIMPHEDGPLFYPVVSTISLGSHTVLDFYYHQDNIEQNTQGVNTSVTSEQNQHHREDKNRITDNNKEDEPEQSDHHKENPTANSFENRHFLSMLLERRSLVLVCKDMYTQHLHGIAEQTHDTITNKILNLQSLARPVSIGETLQRQTRVSLTIRHVPRTVKAKFLFGRR